MRPDMSVDEIMRRWPATIPVMLKHRMLCVGCPVGGFHDLREACRAHAIDEDAFLAEILAAVGEAEAATPPCGSRR